MIFYTYFHTRNDTNAVFYVGKGKGARAQDKACRNPHWNRIVAKCGHTVHIAARWPTEAEAFEHEKFLIACFRDMDVPLCNMTDGGEGMTPTAEVRLKMRKSSALRWSDPEIRKAHGEKTLGRKMPQEEKDRRRISSTGRLHTEASKAKMSAIQSGREISQEHREKLRQANLGKTQTAASNAKRSLSLKGRVFSDAHRAKLSASMMGNKSRLGYATSAETKEKQRASAKQRV